MATTIDVSIIVIAIVIATIRIGFIFVYIP